MKYTFDEETNRIIREAYSYAEEFEDYLGTEHVLMALLEEKTALYEYLVKVLPSEKQCKLRQIMYSIEKEDMDNHYEVTYTIGKKEMDFSEDFMAILYQMPTRKVTLDSLVKMMLTTQCNAFQILTLAEIINEETDNTATTQIVIPNELKDCCRSLNDEFLFYGERKIRERDREIKRIWTILSRQRKRNVILIGKAGTGKTAIAEGIAECIKKGMCPGKFKNKEVISLNINSLVAGTKYRGDMEEKIQLLINFLEDNPDVILFIDEIHLMVGAGKSEGSIDVSNALKPVLSRGKTMVIGATTTEEYEKYISVDKALKRRFELLEVQEPQYDKIYTMLKEQIKESERCHNVSISKDVFEFIQLQASCYDYYTPNPDRTLTLLDDAMALAELEGKSELCKEDVLKVYQENVEVFNHMSEKKKWATAYHEAGHYIVYKHSLARHIYDMIAISIIPTKNYRGANILQKRELDEVEEDRECFLCLIALKLAGRIAQKRYTSTNSSGASSDLQEASEMAREMILYYGLEDEYENLSLYDIKKKDFMYELMSNDEKVFIHEKTKKILEEARKKAEVVIEENKAELDILAKALMKKGMLTAKEVESLLENIKVNVLN